VIIAHSLGGPITLSLLPFLPKEKETTIILVDPVLELSSERLEAGEKQFLNAVVNVKTPDEHMAENPAWSRSDCELRTLGASMCNRTVPERLFRVSFRGADMTKNC
jgi:hypothetical protein